MQLEEEEDEEDEDAMRPPKRRRPLKANEGRMVILLAGRPYHADPFIEHKISHAIADMGIDVITENIAVDEGSAIYNELNAVSQWAYPNRIFK